MSNFETVTPGSAFQAEWGKWQKQLREWRQAYDDWRQVIQQLQEWDEKESKGVQGKLVSFDPNFDVLAVENIMDIGDGEPLFGNFEYEDWLLLSTKVELHLLVHHFRDDTGGAVLDETNLQHYFKMYFRKDLKLEDYGVKSCENLIQLVQDSVCIENALLDYKLPEETPFVTFLKMTEQARRERCQAMEAGDETVAVTFPGAEKEREAKKKYQARKAKESQPPLERRGQVKRPLPENERADAYRRQRDSQSYGKSQSYDKSAWDDRQRERDVPKDRSDRDRERRSDRWRDSDRRSRSRDRRYAEDTSYRESGRFGEVDHRRPIARPEGRSRPGAREGRPERDPTSREQRGPPQTAYNRNSSQTVYSRESKSFQSHAQSNAPVAQKAQNARTPLPRTHPPAPAPGAKGGKGDKGKGDKDRKDPEPVDEVKAGEKRGAATADEPTVKVFGRCIPMGAPPKPDLIKTLTANLLAGGGPCPFPTSGTPSYPIQGPTGYAAGFHDEDSERHRQDGPSYRDRTSARDRPEDLGSTRDRPNDGAFDAFRPRDADHRGGDGHRREREALRTESHRGDSHRGNSDRRDSSCRDDDRRDRSAYSYGAERGDRGYESISRSDYRAVAPPASAGGYGSAPRSDYHAVAPPASAGGYGSAPRSDYRAVAPLASAGGYESIQRSDYRAAAPLTFAGYEGAARSDYRAVATQPSAGGSESTARSDYRAAAPPSGGFGATARSDYHAAAPSSSGYGSTARSDYRAAAPASSGYGSTSRSDYRAAAPASSGYGSIARSDYRPAAPPASSGGYDSTSRSGYRAAAPPASSGGYESTSRSEYRGTEYRAAAPSALSGMTRQQYRDQGQNLGVRHNSEGVGDHRVDDWSGYQSAQRSDRFDRSDPDIRRSGDGRDSRPIGSRDGERESIRPRPIGSRHEAPTVPKNQSYAPQNAESRRADGYSVGYVRAGAYGAPRDGRTAPRISGVDPRDL